MTGRVYDTARWKRLRARHLAIEPLCQPCKAMGFTKAASHVDHKHAISNGGDPYPGHDGLESMCASCHSAKTARGPEHGAIRSNQPRKGCDANGNPLDPRHRWNGGTGTLSREVQARRMPADLRPSAIPLTILCGPPAGGKSTYLRHHAGPHDIIIDLDAIMASLSGLGEHQTSVAWLPQALMLRNDMLRALATDTEHNAAWFIVSAPKSAERRLWAKRLGGTVVLLAPPLSECIRRIKADPKRAGHHDRMIAAAKAWWAANPGVRPATLPGEGQKIREGEGQTTDTQPSRSISYGSDLTDG